MLTQTQVEFVRSLVPAAQACELRWRVPASVSVGQALHESWSSKLNRPSRLALLANNYWGIKAFSSWKGETVTLDTFEFKNGKKIWLKGKDAPKWRKYPTPEAAFDNYGAILHGPLYVSAFDLLPQDPALRTEEQEHAFIEAIAKHWATDPIYARHIEEAEDLVEQTVDEKIAQVQLVTVEFRMMMAASLAGLQAMRGQ